MEHVVDSLVARIREDASTVSTLGREVRADEETLRREEAGVLNGVVADILPHMPHIDHRVPASWHDVTGSGSALDSTSTYMRERGIVLAGGKEEESDDRGSSGSYGGSDLVLTRSGRLLEREFAGCWSLMAGASNGWDTGTLGEGADGDCCGSTRVVTSVEAVRNWGLETILTGIDREVAQALSRKGWARKDVDERMTRFAAIRSALQA